MTLASNSHPCWMVYKASPDRIDQSHTFSTIQRGQYKYWIVLWATSTSSSGFVVLKCFRMKYLSPCFRVGLWRWDIYKSTSSNSPSIPNTCSRKNTISIPHPPKLTNSQHKKCGQSTIFIFFTTTKTKIFFSQPQKPKPKPKPLFFCDSSQNNSQPPIVTYHNHNTITRTKMVIFFHIHLPDQTFFFPHLHREKPTTFPASQFFSQTLISHPITPKLLLYTLYRLLFL